MKLAWGPDRAVCFPLQTTWYSLENCSFIHLKVIHSCTRDYWKIWQQEISRVWNMDRGVGEVPNPENKKSEKHTKQASSASIYYWFCNLLINWSVTVIHSRFLTFTKQCGFSPGSKRIKIFFLHLKIPRCSTVWTNSGSRLDNFCKWFQLPVIKWVLFRNQWIVDPSKQKQLQLNSNSITSCIPVLLSH